MALPQNFDEVKVQEIILEKIRFNVSQSLEVSILKNIPWNLEGYLQAVSKNFVVHLKADILGEKDKLEVKVPSSWWQMFKRDYMPKWFVKKWPVKESTLGFFNYATLYPELKVSLPNEKNYVHVLDFETVKPMRKKNGKATKSKRSD